MVEEDGKAQPRVSSRCAAQEERESLLRRKFGGLARQMREEKVTSSDFPAMAITLRG